MEYLQLLKKHKRDADRSRSLWSGKTPVLQCAYHRNFGEFCFHVSLLVLTLKIREQHLLIIIFMHIIIGMSIVYVQGITCTMYSLCYIVSVFFCTNSFSKVYLIYFALSF